MMCSSLAATSIALLLLGTTFPTQAQDQSLRRVTDEVRVVPTAEIGGDAVRPALPGQWPATLFPLYSEGKCTTTLIGPKVALTAAHCVKHKEVVEFSVDGTKTPYSMTCEWHIASGYHAPPGVPGRGWPAQQRVAASFDYALCKVDREVVGISFERLAKPPQGSVKLKDRVMILGFGCTNLETLRGYGTLRIADTSIARMPGLDGDNYFEIGAYSTSGSYYCQGDSGGAVYRQIGPKITEREIVGVNSVVIAEDVGGALQIAGPSYSASLQSPMAKGFIESWENRGSDYHVCGYSSTHLNCRGGQ
jgi:hypothetical protein